MSLGTSQDTLSRRLGGQVAKFKCLFYQKHEKKGDRLKSDNAGEIVLTL